MSNFNLTELLVRFLIGGAVVVSVWLAAKFFSPRVGGVIAMLPTTFAVAYIFSVGGASAAIANKFVLGSFTGVIAWIFFAPALYFFNLHFGFWTAFTLAYAVWFVVVVALSTTKVLG